MTRPFSESWPGGREKASCRQSRARRKEIGNIMVRLALTAGLFMVILGPMATADTYPQNPDIDILHYVFRLNLSDGTDEIVTAPAHYQVVSNGLLQEETDLRGNLKLTRREQSVPIATSLYVLGVARFAVDHTLPNGQVPIQTRVYPQDRDGSFHDFAVPTPDVLAFYSRWIGPYSYEKLANIQAASVGGGLPRLRGGWRYDNESRRAIVDRSSSSVVLDPDFWVLMDAEFLKISASPSNPTSSGKAAIGQSVREENHRP